MHPRASNDFLKWGCHLQATFLMAEPSIVKIGRGYAERSIEEMNTRYRESGLDPFCLGGAYRLGFG